MGKGMSPWADGNRKEGVPLSQATGSIRREERRGESLETVQQEWKGWGTLSRFSGRSLAPEGSLGDAASKEGRRCVAFFLLSASPL